MRVLNFDLNCVTGVDILGVCDIINFANETSLAFLVEFAYIFVTLETGIVETPRVSKANGSI